MHNTLPESAYTNVTQDIKTGGGCELKWTSKILWMTSLMQLLTNQLSKTWETLKNRDYNTFNTEHELQKNSSRIELYDWMNWPNQCFLWTQGWKMLWHMDRGLGHLPWNYSQVQATPGGEKAAVMSEVLSSNSKQSTLTSLALAFSSISGFVSLIPMSFSHRNIPANGSCHSARPTRHQIDTAWVLEACNTTKIYSMESLSF